MREFIICWSALLVVLLCGIIYFRIIEGEYDWVLVTLSTVMIAVEIITQYFKNKD